MIVLRGVVSELFVSANYSCTGLVELSIIGVGGVRSESKTKLNRMLALEVAFNLESFASEISLALNFTSGLVKLKTPQVHLSDLAQLLYVQVPSFARKSQLSCDRKAIKLAMLSKADNLLAL